MSNDDSYFGLRTRGKVNEACVRSALLHRAETWALTSKLMDVLCSCDRRMLRYMVGVRWQDLSIKLRQRRLKWFGYVKRAEGVCWMNWGGENCG